MLSVDPHPLLDLQAFVTTFPRPLAELASPPSLLALLSLDAGAPLASDDAIREAVRSLLRQGGFKPTGRSKPASEYLIRAVREGQLGSINVAVDACNVASLHSGLPISVVDLDLAREPFRVGIAPSGSSYVFNSSEQTIDLAGLLCLFDADGPCGSPVKDSQRTKTRPRRGVRFRSSGARRPCRSARSRRLRGTEICWSNLGQKQLRHDRATSARVTPASSW